MQGTKLRDLAGAVILALAAAFVAAMLNDFLCAGAAQAQEQGCKDGFCWEVYSPSVGGGETMVKITKWPWRRSTHRNIRWDCESGGCQVEGDTLHLGNDFSGTAHQLSVQACIRHRLRRPKCSNWTSFTVH